MDDWKRNLVEDDAGVAALVKGLTRIAVLGVKTEAQADQAAFYVARYVADHGGEVVPVPVYYPEATEILGRKVYRRLVDVPGDLDLVDVFRKPSDIPGHLDDLLAKKPRAVWFQLGIRNDAAAEVLARAGIQVVQDRCLKVEWGRFR
ncbi:MAG: CoA-binding protein [Anaeromyxobacter sp.]|nr:CoA-binding protein [Anaeromyxobacter sp.]MBL0275408.1 CoA-binding protein [Anaeromyxobacter sp.]